MVARGRDDLTPELALLTAILLQAVRDGAWLELLPADRAWLAAILRDGKPG